MFSGARCQILGAVRVPTLKYVLAKTATCWGSAGRQYGNDAFAPDVNSQAGDAVHEGCTSRNPKNVPDWDDDNFTASSSYPASANCNDSTLTWPETRIIIEDSEDESAVTDEPVPKAAKVGGTFRKASEKKTGALTPASAPPSLPPSLVLESLPQYGQKRDRTLYNFDRLVKRGLSNKPGEQGASAAE
ncbi:uncharacterized protein RHO25_001700 [Cercospora beticola]|uniref:Uncharacterized protein n=1 Tax=Cercospora beticola TaxID=122368 RepID=A0ABZ0NC36_CERBT|nr:hypothetical protein RHO25_001700 [Cercospora beticola]